MSPSVAAGRDLRPLQVLVVEDEAFVAMLIADQLDELGHRIVGPAFSVSEARPLATATTIDLALVDWNLRGEFAGEIVEILAERNIPFVFVTGYADSPVESLHREAGLLHKPFLTNDLRRVIEQIFQNCRAE